MCQHGFLDLLAHDAAQPVVDHGGRITPNTRRQGLVAKSDGGGKQGEEDDPIVGGTRAGPKSADVMRALTGHGAGPGGRALFRSSAAGSAVLPAAMRFFLQVVALEPRAIIGGGSDPRQFVHDAAMCWSSDVVGTHALAFSISHLLAFLVSRGQVDYVSRICRAMLGNSGDIQNVELQARGSRGVFDGRRVARGEKMDEDVTMKNDDRDAEVESYREWDRRGWMVCPSLPISACSENVI